MASSVPTRTVLLTALSCVSACSASDDDADYQGVSRETCDAVAETVSACLDRGCVGADADAPGCRCWLDGAQDLNAVSCRCMPMDWTASCRRLPPTMTPDEAREGLDCPGMIEDLRGVCVR